MLSMKRWSASFEIREMKAKTTVSATLTIGLQQLNKEEEKERYEKSWIFG